MQQLPLLIQNTIDFYRWRIWIQKLHEEYQMKVYIGSSHDCQILMWDYCDGYIFICYIFESRSYRKSQIQNYTTGGTIIDFVPKKYHFSSGMRDKSGYTDRLLVTFKN